MVIFKIVTLTGQNCLRVKNFVSNCNFTLYLKFLAIYPFSAGGVGVFRTQSNFEASQSAQVHEHARVSTCVCMHVSPQKIT